MNQANLSIIVACDNNNLIGRLNHLPWNIKEDLTYFREKTMGHPVVMGHNTWLSLGKPLDGRVNIILTQDNDFSFPGCLVMHSVPEVISAFPTEEVFIIGGAKIFASFMPFVKKIYLTRINSSFTGDTYFPEPDWSKWQMISYERMLTQAGWEIFFELWTQRES